MMGRDFVWFPVWALLTYNGTKFDGPGKWVWLKTLYWEWHDNKRIYYVNE